MISAAGRLNAEVCGYLLARGANPNAKDDHETAALSTVMEKHIAVKNISNAQQIAELLLKHHAEVNTRDPAGLAVPAQRLRSSVALLPLNSVVCHMLKALYSAAVWGCPCLPQ